MNKKIFSHWPWFVTGPVLAGILIVFWQMDQSFFHALKSPVAVMLENPLLTFGLVVFGAFLSAYLFGDFAIRVPLTFEPFGYAFAGGILMGAGAALAAMSVHSTVLFNLAGIFTLTAGMLTQGWIYVVCMVVGGWVGARLFLATLVKFDNARQVDIPRSVLPDERSLKKFFLIVVGCGAFFMVMIAFFSVLSVTDKIRFFLSVGLLILFGIAVERGTVCMSSMLKECFLARSAVVWRAVLFTIMCLALFYWAGIGQGWFLPFKAEPFVERPGFLILGSFLMGLGFVFADGCFIGSLWKIGQGHVINIFGFFGMIIGTGVTQAILKGVPQSQGAGLVWNILSNYFSPVAYVILLWIIGGTLLLLFQQRTSGRW